MTYYIVHRPSKDLFILADLSVAAFDQRKVAQAFVDSALQYCGIERGTLKVVADRQVSARHFALLQLSRQSFLSRDQEGFWVTNKVMKGQAYHPSFDSGAA